MSEHSVVLKWNNSAVWDNCPVCKEQFKASLGMVPFLEGTWAPVCDDCTSKQAPIIQAGAIFLSTADDKLLHLAGIITRAYEKEEPDTGTENTDVY